MFYEKSLLPSKQENSFTNDVEIPVAIISYAFIWSTEKKNFQATNWCRYVIRETNLLQCH